ncbi:MAG: thiamine pyrophosphate-dependent enzyme, partial [Pseudomonadota bacterium]
PATMATVTGRRSLTPLPGRRTRRVARDARPRLAHYGGVPHPRRPLSWLDPGAFCMLGVGAGFALAAAVARPDAEVWLLWGDGAAGYGLAEHACTRARDRRRRPAGTRERVARAHRLPRRLDLDADLRVQPRGRARETIEDRTSSTNGTVLP